MKLGGFRGIPGDSGAFRGNNAYSVLRKTLYKLVQLGTVERDSSDWAAPFYNTKEAFWSLPRKCAPACVEKGWDKLRCVIFLRSLEDGRPCSSLCGRPRRESQEASCNFDKASKKDVTLRRRGDDENGNDSNPTKIMLEAGVCRHTPDSSMSFVGLLPLSFSSSPIKNRCFEIIGGNYSHSDQVGNYFSYNTIYTLMFSAMQSEYEAK